jgi:hypothetical protein
MFAAHKTRHFTLTTVLCVFIFTPPPPGQGSWVGGSVSAASTFFYILELC